MQNTVYNYKMNDNNDDEESKGERRNYGYNSKSSNPHHYNDQNHNSIHNVKSLTKGFILSLMY